MLSASDVEEISMLVEFVHLVRRWIRSCRLMRNEVIVKDKGCYKAPRPNAPTKTTLRVSI